MGLRDGIGFTLEVFRRGSPFWDSILTGGKDLAGLNNLFQQLSARDTKLLDPNRLFMLSQLSGFVLVLARNSTECVVGMGTLTVKKTLTRNSGYIDDVVVDLRFRDYGIGKAIIKRLILFGTELNLSHIDLTSNPNNPHRVAAIELYDKLGFVKRDTNYYRLEL